MDHFHHAVPACQKFFTARACAASYTGLATCFRPLVCDSFVLQLEKLPFLVLQQPAMQSVANI